MSNSINEYMETDLGNVSPNPRGYYNSTSEYEYLDLIEFEGGSYICVIELGSTVKGIAPTPGTSTTVWQCIAIPGDLTPEYQRIYEDVINKHQEVQNNTVHVNEVKSYLDTLKQNIENEVADANTSADNAKTSELKAKTSEELAKNAQTLAENSNKETNKTISDFNDNLQNVIDESVNTINQSKENAITTINEQKERSVLEVQTETSQYIADEKNIAMQDIHDAIDDFNSTTDAKRTDIIASGDEKINTMNEILKDVTDIQNKVQTTETSTKEYASNAQKSAENAEFSKLSAKAIEDSVIEKGNSIESIHNQILLDKNAVSADKVAVSEMKTSVANISQEIIDKKTEAITAIEEYGAVQVSATQPTSEHVDLWIDDTSEEEYSLPEIKDNEINETDTWSSQKIDNEIGELKSDLDYAKSFIISELDETVNIIKTDTKITKGKILSKSDGITFVNDSYSCIFDYTKVKGNTAYSAYSPINSYYVFYYDKDKNFISYKQMFNNFTTPENCKYVRFVINKFNTAYADSDISLIDYTFLCVKIGTFSASDFDKYESPIYLPTRLKNSDYITEGEVDKKFTKQLQKCISDIELLNNKSIVSKDYNDFVSEYNLLYRFSEDNIVSAETFDYTDIVKYGKKSIKVDLSAETIIEFDIPIAETSTDKFLVYKLDENTEGISLSSFIKILNIDSNGITEEKYLYYGQYVYNGWGLLKLGTKDVKNIKIIDSNNGTSGISFYLDSIIFDYSVIKRPFVLTFDASAQDVLTNEFTDPDDQDSKYTVYSLLTKYGMKATIGFRGNVKDEYNNKLLQEGWDNGLYGYVGRSESLDQNDMSNVQAMEDGLNESNKLLNDNGLPIPVAYRAPGNSAPYPLMVALKKSGIRICRGTIYSCEQTFYDKDNMFFPCMGVFFNETIDNLCNKLDNFIGNADYRRGYSPSTYISCITHQVRDKADYVNAFDAESETFVRFIQKLAELRDNGLIECMTFSEFYGRAFKEEGKIENEKLNAKVNFLLKQSIN